MNDYTERITALIKAQGKSWAMVSRITGISETTLAHCRKVNKYTSEQLDKIAQALNLSVSELTDFEGEHQRFKELTATIKKLKTMLRDDFD